LKSIETNEKSKSLFYKLKKKVNANSNEIDSKIFYSRNFPSNANIENKTKLEAEISKSGAVLETKQFG